MYVVSSKMFCVLRQFVVYTKKTGKIVGTVLEKYRLGVGG